MKKSWKSTLTASLLFSLVLILTGCFSPGKNGTMEEKMDDSMSGSVEVMEKDNMHDSMSGSMDMMEGEKKDKMKQEGMQDAMN